MGTPAAAQTTTVTATWEANTDSLTRGYILYYGTSPGSYQWSQDTGAQTSAQITLSQGSRYYFIVRAYDATGVLGPPSTEATFDLGVAGPTATIAATLQDASTALVTWSTGNAATATINGVPVALSGSASVPITGSTTFTIVATGSGGTTATDSATVTIPLPTATLSATLQSATTALVTWSTGQATAVTINGVAVALSGSTTVPVSATTTFTLVATGPGGTTTRTATVTVTAPAPTATLTASLQGGTSALLTWSTTNATSATINGNSVGLSGSMSVPIASTTTFTLVATGAGGTVSRSATVTLPTASLAPGAPTTMLATVSGARVTLTWRAPGSGPAPTHYLLDVGTTWGGTEIARGYNVGNVLRVSADLPRGRYYARVRAANAGGMSAYSNLTSFRVGTRLVSPSGFTVRWIGTEAVLTWTQPAGASPDEQPTSYVIEAGSAPGRSDAGAIDVGRVTTFRTRVPAGRRYFVRVRGVSEAGESEPTEDLELRPGGRPAVPGPPRRLAASAADSLITLRWDAPAGGEPVTGYQIEAGSVSGASDVAVIQVGQVTTYAAVAPKGTHYVRVRALGAGAVGQASNEVVIQR
jgi:hypothetical protein